MTSDGETLGDLVAQERARLGLSLRQLAAKCGGSPTSSTIHEIEAGKRTAVGREHLTALAGALGLPAGRLLAAAGRSRHHLGRFDLPAEADELDAAERRLVRQLVSALLAARRKAGPRAPENGAETQNGYRTVRGRTHDGQNRPG